MDAQKHEHDNDDDGAQAHREKATGKLDEIVHLMRHRLKEHEIYVPIFFLIPRSGDAIISFGTPGDPPEGLWDQISEMVCSVVRETIGIDRLRTRAVICAATDDGSSS